MDTFFAKNRLSAYLDGALPDGEAAEVAEAIERDPELKAEYEQLRMAVAALRRHGPVSAPEGFSARVLAAVEAEPGQSGMVVQFRRFFRRVPVEALAVAAAALLVVLAAGSQLGGSTPSTPAVATAPSTPAPAQTDPELATETHAAAAPASTDSPTGASPAPEGAPEAEPSVLPKQQASPRQKAMPTAPAGANGAYVPDWESDKADDKAFGGMEGLRLSISDPEVMQKLYMVAESHGGRMLDEASQPLRPYSLSSDNSVARVLLLVPVDRAAGLRSQLQSFGAVPGGATPAGATLAAGYSGFFLQLELVE